MSLIYKSLFEIKFTHEYYHTAGDGKTIFALNNQQDRIRFLMNEFEVGHPSILQDLEFRFPKALKKFYADHEIRLLPSYSGIKVVIRVSPKTLADNSLVFIPVNRLPENIFIRIVKKSTAFCSYTQARIRDGLPAGYIFSSDNINGPKSFPYLTSNVALFDSAVTYEQGELASFGPGDIREFIQQGASPEWNGIKGNAFANPNDLSLLSRKFDYAMDANGLPDVVIELKDAGGNSIKTVSVSNNNYRKIPLDFSNLPELADDDIPAFTDRLYALEIRSSNGFFQRRRMVLSDNLFSPEDAGIIHIASAPTNSAFNLLSGDGYLFRRRNPSGVWSNAPVFEIPFKGRSAFWKYRNNKGNSIQFNPDLNGYLRPEEGFLISPKPLPVSRYHFVMHKDGSTDTKYIPNPVEYNLIKDASGRFCFDILVPDSKLFPI